MIPLRSVAVAVSLLVSSRLPACSSASPSPAQATFPNDPYVEVTSASANLRVAVRTSPQPPPRGTFAVKMTITDRSGAPVEGLSLDVVPWMVAHGHGTAIKPSVTPDGPGEYLVSDVNLFMPGTWELRTSITGRVTDHVAPALAIP